jgi:hypothetical protein
MDPFRADALLRPHLSWLDGAPPVLSEAASDLPLQDPDFADWRPVARGPQLASTGYDDAVDAWIWQRQGEPGALWLGLGATCPPALFFRAEDPARLMGLLDRFFLRPPESGEHACIFDVFLGVTPTMREIENRLAVDIFTHTIPLRLGTAATSERPFPEDAEQEMVLRTQVLTRHSESVLDLAGWHGGPFAYDGRIVVARLHYAPASDAELVRGYNIANGKDFPENLPVDVVGALHGMPSLPPRLVEEQIRTGSEPTFMLGVLALVLANDPERAQAAMRSMCNDPSEQLSRLARELLHWLLELQYE